MPTTAKSSGALRTWSRPADEGTRPLIHRLVAETSPQRDDSQLGKNITKTQALDHVIGYSISNDASIRDYQLSCEGPSINHMRAARNTKRNRYRAFVPHLIGQVPPINAHPRLSQEET
jgi:hypothetical protein